MNTLSKEITKEFFLDKENGYEQLEARWKELIKSGYKPDVEQILLYQILRGKDWTKSFSPITNKNKLENDGWFESGIYLAITRIHNSFYLNSLSLFNKSRFGEGILTDEAISLAKSFIPKCSDVYQPCEFTSAYSGVTNTLATR